MRKIICAALITAAALVQQSWAQEAQSPKPRCVSGSGGELSDNKCITDADLLGLLDLSTPENSLFTLMGSTPDTVIRPKVGDKLMVSVLPQLSDALQSEQYAVGVEVNPGLWMMPESFTVAEYQGQRRGRDWGDSAKRVEQLRSAQFWSRFTVSAAATRTINEGKLSRIGVGVNYNYDSGAPLEVLRSGNFARCIGSAFPINKAMEVLRAEDLAEDAIRKAPRDSAGTTLEDRDPQEFDRQVVTRANELLERGAEFAPLRAQEANAAEKIAACGNEVSAWNREVHGAGIAFYTAESKSPETAGGPGVKSQSSGVGAWASYARPFGESGQIALSVRYTDNLLRERQVGEDTIQESVDGWRVGARYTQSFSEGARAGDQRAVRGFIETVYAEEKFGNIDDEYTQAGIGMEIQLQKNLFFQFVIGDTYGSQIDRSEYLSGQIRWSFSEAPAQ